MPALPVFVPVDYSDGMWHIVRGNDRRRSPDFVPVPGDRVVATAESVPKLSLRGADLSLRRLAAVYWAVAGEEGRNAPPCLIFWMDERNASLGLIESGSLASEKHSKALSPWGVFEGWASLVPALRVLVDSEFDDVVEQVFRDFLASLRRREVASARLRWMRPHNLKPYREYETAFSTLRREVDPDRKAKNIILAGWAAAGWNLSEVVSRDGLSVVPSHIDGFKMVLDGLAKFAAVRAREGVVPASTRLGWSTTTTESGPVTRTPPRRPPSVPVRVPFWSRVFAKIRLVLRKFSLAGR